MVMPNDRHHGIRKPNRRQEVGPDVCVSLHGLELCRRKLPRLVQDVLRYRQLPHVMEQGSRLDRLELRRLCYAKSLREFNRIDLNTSDMAMCDLILRVDCHRQRFDSGQIKIIDLGDVSIRISKPAQETFGR